MLGDAVYHTFKDRCHVVATDIDCNTEWLSPLDVRDGKAVRAMAETLKPDYIFHLAAHTDVEYCELHPEESFETNALATEHVARTCQALDIPMIYISTAGVFDSSKNVYNDYDEPRPLSIYGQSKFAGEKVVQTLLNRFFIFRAGWMMGGGPKKDKKFINKVIKQIQAGSKELFIVDDKLGSPTYTYDFAKNLGAVVDSENFGLYHMVGQGDCSRYDVAVRLVELLGLTGKITITKVDSSHFAKEYFAPRPYSEKLINLKLNLLKLNLMRPWNESLEAYIKSHEWIS